MLESDLIMISTNATEAEDYISASKKRFPLAFQATASVPAPEPPMRTTASDQETDGPEQASEPPLEETPVAIVPEAPPEPLPQDDQVPAEVMEFFVPEAEDHLQVVTDCLLSLEPNPGPEQIHRLLRAMHTVKGSSAQVGLHRISHVAHRPTDLIGRLRAADL